MKNYGNNTKDRTKKQTFASIFARSAFHFKSEKHHKTYQKIR